MNIMQILATQINMDNKSIYIQAIMYVTQILDKVLELVYHYIILMCNLVD